MKRILKRRIVEAQTSTYGSGKNIVDRKECESDESPGVTATKTICAMARGKLA